MLLPRSQHNRMSQWSESKKWFCGLRLTNISVAQVKEQSFYPFAYLLCLATRQEKEALPCSEWKSRFLKWSAVARVCAVRTGWPQTAQRSLTSSHGRVACQRTLAIPSRWRDVPRFSGKISNEDVLLIWLLIAIELSWFFIHSCVVCALRNLRLFLLRYHCPLIWFPVFSDLNLFSHTSSRLHIQVPQFMLLSHILLNSGTVCCSSSVKCPNCVKLHINSQQSFLLFCQTSQRRYQNETRKKTFSAW